MDLQLNRFSANVSGVWIGVGISFDSIAMELFC